MHQKFIPAEDVIVHRVGSVDGFVKEREAANRRARGEPEPLPPVRRTARDTIESAAPRAPSIGEAFKR